MKIIPLLLQVTRDFWLLCFVEHHFCIPDFFCGLLCVRKEAVRFLLSVTLTRQEGQPCLSSGSSDSSSCVTSTQRLHSNLKGPGLLVSLPTHPRTPDRSTGQMPLPTDATAITLTPAALSGRENTHSCTAPVVHTDKHVPYHQQQTVAWLAGAADKAQTQPARPCRHQRSGGGKHWPPATSSQLYICHMLMTSSLRPPTDRAVLEGSRLRNKVVSPWNASLILSLWHSVAGLEGFNPSLNCCSAVKSLLTFQRRASSLSRWVWLQSDSE